MITIAEIKISNQGSEKEKTGDRSNWKAGGIKEGGEEMVQCLANIFNRVKEENKIPIHGRKTKLKSIYQGGNKERIQESQRGIFLTNTVKYMKEWRSSKMKISK